MRTSLNNPRGAVFLLVIYFASALLLLLGGLSLQRTTMEVRASQLSRDLQQAFWSAEAGMDQGLAALRLGQGLGQPIEPALPQLDRTVETAYRLFAAQQGEIRDGVYGPFTTSAGTYLLDVHTTKFEILGPDSLRVTRVITATGRPRTDAAPASVTATIIAENLPLSGFFSNGPVLLSSSGVKGSIHTGAGVPGSIWIDDTIAEAHVFGDLTIGPPDKEQPYEALIGGFDWGAPHDVAQGPPYFIPPEKPGIMFSRSRQAGWTPKKTVAGTIGVAELPKIQGIPFPDALYPLSAERPVEPLIVAAGEQRSVDDGGPDDLDPSLGAIVLRVDSLQVSEQAALLFRAPATVYIQKHEEADRYAVKLKLDSVVVALDDEEQTIPDGVQLVVTTPVAGEPGPVMLYHPRAFYGSIWAPDSDVTFKDNDWWLAFRDGEGLHRYERYLRDPGAPGGRQGLQYGYIVAGELASVSGCSSLLVEEASNRSGRSRRAGDFSVLDWRNTTQIVIPPVSETSSTAEAPH